MITTSTMPSRDSSARQLVLGDVLEEPPSRERKPRTHIYSTEESELLRRLGYEQICMVCNTFEGDSDEFVRDLREHGINLKTHNPRDYGWAYQHCRRVTAHGRYWAWRKSK